jgi:hypothetical protein
LLDYLTIFSIADAQAITNTSYQATAALLSQLVRKGWLVRLVPGKYLIVPLEAGLESIPMADRYVIAREVPKSEIPLLLAPCTFAARTFMGYNWYRAKAGEGKAVSPVVLRQAGFIFWFHSYIEANHERILERWYEHRGDTE